MRLAALVMINLIWPTQAVLGDSGATDNVGIAALITQVGLSGVFLWQWYTERKERQSSDARWEIFAEKALPVLSECSVSLKGVADSFTTTVDRASSVPSRGDFDVLQRRSELATDQLVTVATVLNDTLAEIRKSRGQ